MTYPFKVKPRKQVGAKYEVGSIVWLGYVRCKVLRVECFHGQYLYDLKAVSVRVNKVYGAIKEQYVSLEYTSRTPPQSVITEGL